MTESEALEILTRDDEEIRKGFFCINDFLAIDVAKKALEEVQQLHAIGTVEEFQQLKEKATAKKPIDRIMFKECPNCGAVDIANCGCCPECGQKLDWSEGKE